jgi:hypothetical protein
MPLFSSLVLKYPISSPKSLRLLLDSSLPSHPPIYLTDHLFELLFLALVSNRIIYHCDPPAVIIPSRIVSSCTPAYFLLRLLLLSV